MLRAKFKSTVLYRQMYPHTPHPSKEVYRYMHEKDHIDDFLKGKIRISTLSACREYENQEMGDKDEAKEIYKVTHLTDKDPNFHEKARKLRVDIGINAHDLTFVNCMATKRLPDGFVLCTTSRRDDKKFSKDFGSFCLKINDSEQFFHLVSKAIAKKLDLIDGHHEGVIYREQQYSDDELPPGKIGFVKRIKYCWQEEYRFLWLPHNWSIDKYLEIDVPEIKHLCERVL